jgi:CTP:molybdopterin cytidylyltransferase MocA
MIPLGAIVLAAGASSRMGRPKALLPLESGETFVARLHATLVAAGLDPVVVVARAELRDEIAAAVPGARLVVNDEPDRGQLSSLLVGLDALGACEAAMVTLVDLPLVTADTARTIAGTWRNTGAPLVRPVYDGRNGHPVIFGARLIAALREADLNAGAKPVLRAFVRDAVDVPVTDAGTVRDIDTPDDYAETVRTT